MNIPALTAADIHYLPPAVSWQDAIRLSLLPLLERGAADPEYADAIIQNTLEFGPYYILLPEIALIHGRPEQGARSEGLAVTGFSAPVEFPENRPVRLVFAITALDSENHLSVMAYLSRLLSDEEHVKKLLSAASAEELCAVCLSDLPIP